MLLYHYYHSFLPITFIIIINVIGYIIKVIGYSMEQQQQQDNAAVQPRRSSRSVESPLAKETRINANENKSPFVNRRLLPTQRNRSSPAAVASLINRK
jgi:hypothetical protein